jgi:hypothetical protein
MRNNLLVATLFFKFGIVCAKRSKYMIKYSFIDPFSQRHAPNSKTKITVKTIINDRFKKKKNHNPNMNDLELDTRGLYLYIHLLIRLCCGGHRFFSVTQFTFGREKIMCTFEKQH